MKNFFRLATCALALCVVAVSAMAQAPAPPPVVLSNIVDGVGPIAGGVTNWGGLTELALISGSSMLGVKSTTNFLSIGFFGGSTVDVANMVLYKTARNSTTVLSAKKVLLGGKANPSINLTSSATCPIQPLSLATPCIVKLDVVKGALSPLNDYYLAISFLSDSNNTSVLGVGGSSAQGALSGYFVPGDQTRIKKNGSLPPGYSGGSPYFLMYVTNQ